MQRMSFSVGVDNVRGECKLSGKSKKVQFVTNPRRCHFSGECKIKYTYSLFANSSMHFPTLDYSTSQLQLYNILLPTTRFYNMNYKTDSGARKIILRLQIPLFY